MSQESKINSISITRALSELNTNKKRLNKLMDGTVFMSTKISGRPWSDHIHETKKNWQAINDLLKRYEKLKFGVITSNANTKVTIGGRTYTVAEAIAMKEVLQQKRSLLDRMRKARHVANNIVDEHTVRVQQKLDNLLETNFKKEKKTDENDIKTITEAYLKNNRIELVDPLKLEQEISKLDEELDSFTKEVDFVLSESNALTKINLD